MAEIYSRNKDRIIKCNKDCGIDLFSIATTIMLKEHFNNYKIIEFKSNIFQFYNTFDRDKFLNDLAKMSGGKE